MKLEFGEFQNADVASEYLHNWLNERGINEWLGADELHTYYKTEFGALMPTLVQQCYGSFRYSVQIELKYGNLPSRKFNKIKKNKANTVDIVVDDIKYKIQRVPYKEASELLPLINWLGEGPLSIDETKDKYSKNDRKEILYFNLLKIENDTETVIGIAEFTYFAIWDTYKNSQLSLYLDVLTEEWGVIGYTIERYGCGLKNKEEISPYILAFETIHDEIPHNKELDKFINNKNCMNELSKSAMYLSSKYVKVPEEDITLISISQKRDKMFSYYKKYKDFFINYQRSVKNTSGNASQNSLKY